MEVKDDKLVVVLTITVVLVLLILGASALLTSGIVDANRNEAGFNRCMEVANNARSESLCIDVYRNSGY